MVETLAPERLRAAAADDRGRLRDVRARRARRRRDHVRRARAARRRARRQRALRRRRDRADRRRRRGARTCGSSPRSAARSPSPGAASCPSRSPPASTASCSGLGFTTFILTFAVWALAGISVALGDPAIGRRDRARVRRRPRAAGDRARAVRRRARCTPRWPSGRASCARCARSTPPRSPSPPLTLATAPAQAAVSVFAVGYADAGLDGPLLALHRPGGQGEIRGPDGHARRCPATTPRSAAAGPPTSSAATIQVEGGAGDPGARRRRGRGLDDLGGVAHGGRASTPRRWTRRRSRARSSPATSAGRCSSGNLLRVRDRRPHRGHRPRDRRAPLLRREARAELRGPSVRGLPPDLHQGDLQAPAGPDRPCCCRAARPRDRTLYGTTPTARRDAGHEPGRVHARGPHQQAAVAAPAGGRLGHADDDGDERRAPSTSPASASRAAASRRADVDPRRPLIAPSSAWVGARSMIRWLPAAVVAVAALAAPVAAAQEKTADRGRLARRGGERRPARHAGRDRRHARAAATRSTRRSPRPPCSAWSSRTAAASAAAASWSSATARRARSRRSTAARSRPARWCRAASSSTASRRPTRSSTSTATAGCPRGVPGHAVRVVVHPAQVRDAEAERGARATASTSPARASRSTRRSSTRRRRTSPYFDDIPSTAALYLDADGTPKDIGTVVKNPDMARTYERMGRLGVTKGFYTGPVADAMVKAATQPPVGAHRRPHVAARPADQPRPRRATASRSASP